MEQAEWKKEADVLAETDPVRAYDLYSQIALVCASDDLGKGRPNLRRSSRPTRRSKRSWRRGRNSSG